MSRPQCERPCWIQTIIIFIGLCVLAWWTLQEPMLPDEDDCRARGLAADCWKDFIGGR